MVVGGDDFLGLVSGQSVISAYMEMGVTDCPSV